MYKLSQLADGDFAGIYDYTLFKFGEAQADRYTEALAAFLETLSQMPDMGLELERLPGVRRIVFHAHNIFYTSQSDWIFVARILHQQMDASRHGFDSSQS